MFITSSGWFECTEPSLSTSLHGKQGVQGAYATSSNLLTTHQLYRCVEFYHITKLLYLQQSRKFSVCRVVVHLFGVVQAHRTSSKTYTNHIITEIARCVELYHMSLGGSTVPNLIVTGETRSAGCLCTSSGWFKHIEPHRTYSNHNITEIARCGEVCHMSSGWFNCKNGRYFTLGKEGRNTYVGTCS